MRGSKTEQREPRRGGGVGGGEGEKGKKSEQADQALWEHSMHTGMAASPPGLCPSCWLDLKHPSLLFHSYWTSETQRRRCLREALLDWLYTGSGAFQKPGVSSTAGSYPSSLVHGSLVLWSDSAVSFSQSYCNWSPPHPQHGLVPITTAGQGQRGGAGRPWEYAPCPERSLSAGEFHKVPSDQQLFPSPKTANRRQPAKDRLK